MTNTNIETDEDIEQEVLRVLLVEDEEISSSLMQTILTQKGYDVTVARDGKEGLACLEDYNYPVVVTDIHMPVMDGVEMIEHIKKSKKQPVLIVVSGVEDVNTVITIMKKGVFDYITKPINRTDFTAKVDKAFEIADIRTMKKSLMKEREILHSRKIDWAAWKEAILNKDIEKIDQNLFSNLSTSLSQGAGFGGIISLISLLPMQSKKEAGNYIIPESLIDLIIENASSAEQIIEEFSSIGHIMNTSFDLEEVELSEIAEAIEETKNENQELIDVKNQHLLISEFRLGHLNEKLMVNKKYFKRAFRELLINACKFSENETNILVFFDHDNDDFRINITNKPMKTQDGILGIPQEYEKMVFQPFFRLFQTVNEAYPTLDFGIGLSMVKTVVKKHGGNIQTKNFTDYSNLDNPKELRVSFEITLPLH